MRFASLLMPTVVISFCLLHVFGAVSMRRFLADTPRLQSPADLDRYRHMVRFQMLSALALMGVGLVAVALMLIGVGGYLSLVVILVGGLAAKPLMRLQQRCRSVPAEAALRAEYDRISQIWEAKAWPSFPSGEPGRTAQVSVVTCAVHGADSNAHTCRRCGTFECAACSDGSLGQALCGACRAHYEALRDRHWPDERNVRVAGMIAMWLALNGVLLLLSGAPSTPSWQIGVGLIVGWEAATFVAGALLIALTPGVRRLSFVLLAPHLLVFPIGTVATAFAMYTVARGGALHPLSAVYTDVVAFTQPRSLGLVLPTFALAVATVGQAVLLFGVVARFLPS